MPELPEVETVLRGILPYAEKQKILNIIVRNRNMRWTIPHSLEEEAIGTTILAITRRSKYLLFATSSGTIMMHLGMSGVLSVVDSNTALKKHDHVDIVLANGKILRLNDPRRFGSVLWSKGDILQHRLLVDLAPEPLSDDFNATYLIDKLSNRKTCIKVALMNSKIVVGVGNIYASESLFKSKISPQRLANSLSATEITVLVTEIKKVLKKSIEAGGTTLKDFAQADGKPGYFAQELSVYGRKGLPCIVCNNDINHITIANRATYFCATCQI